jgi:acyl-CoA synthetase (AMP-forming)/AMP-acid ligase II
MLKSRVKKITELTRSLWINTDEIDPEASLHWEKPLVNTKDLALIQYTSGSTGNPKGVMVNHENLLHNQHMIKRAVGYTKESISVGWLPQFHDLGLIGQVLQPLFLGFPHIFMSPVAFMQKPARWLQTISRYRATTSGGPNFAYDLCVRKISPEQRKNFDLTSWQVAFVGAEPIQAETIDRFAMSFGPCGFRREALYPCYGLAEATLFVSGGKTSEPPIVKKVESAALSQNQIRIPSDNHSINREIVGCGRAWLDQKILIVDPETLRECQKTQVGEIWVSGSSVAQGFWNQREESNRVFRAYLSDTGGGPFLRTGDLGFMQDEELFVTGRLKDLIIIGGQNHYPQDIELTVQESHAALRAGCGGAFSVDQPGEEKLVIFQEVEPRFLRTVDVKDVVRTIQQTVSEQSLHNRSRSRSRARRYGPDSDVREPRIRARRARRSRP